VEASRFDLLSRVVSAQPTRRGIAAAVLLLATGGLTQESALTVEAKEKKKKPCPPCRKRKKGKCKKALPDGTQCGGACQVCQGGQCVAKTNGTACGNVCQECRDGQCAAKANETACGGPCEECQSGQCAAKASGASCGTNGICQGGLCFPRGTCGNDTAACPDTVECGTQCLCGKSVEGNTVCMQNASFCPSPTHCDTSADCAQGEACIDVTGCCGGSLPAGSTVCLGPCTDPNTP
jgi:hypothetical protein